MTINYEELKALVKEAMFTGGGINEPSAPEGIPHRMGSQDPSDQEQNMGDPKANELYAMAVDARAAVEELIVGLDEPIFDGAYESAFKASACLRHALNDIEAAGAHPMPDERVVAPTVDQQKYNSGGGDFGGGAGFIGADFGLQENIEGFPPNVKEAIDAFEKLSRDEVPLFHAYFAGDARTSEEGEI